MCGIYGITERNKKVIENIIEKCSHRGRWFWNSYNDNLTLGHNLLSITSKSKDGKQPWISERENVLIFNGEIFNYNELINNYKDSFFQEQHVILNYLVGYLITLNMKEL